MLFSAQKGLTYIILVVSEQRWMWAVLLHFCGSRSYYASLAMMLLFSGVKVLFRTALLVMRTVLGTTEKLAECPSFYETLEKLRLRQMPPELLDEEFITREVSNVAVITTGCCKAVQWNPVIGHASSLPVLSTHLRTHGGSLLLSTFCLWLSFYPPSPIPHSSPPSSSSFSSPDSSQLFSMALPSQSHSPSDFLSIFQTPPPLFFVYLPPTPHTIKARKGKNEVQLLDNNNNNIYGTQSHKNPESLQRHKDIYAHFNTHTHTHTHVVMLLWTIFYYVGTSFPLQQFT